MPASASRSQKKALPDVPQTLRLPPPSSPCLSPLSGSALISAGVPVCSQQPAKPACHPACPPSATDGCTSRYCYLRPQISPSPIPSISILIHPINIHHLKSSLCNDSNTSFFTTILILDTFLSLRIFFYPFSLPFRRSSAVF